MSGAFRAEQVAKSSLKVIQLRDQERDLLVSILPSRGNMAYELLHGGGNWLWSPFRDPLTEMDGSTALFGIPLLSPWANRLSSDTYKINGVEYTLNRRINNLRVDHNYLAIHGLVLFAPWTIGDLGTDAHGAYLRSTLHFTRRAPWMAQFPFAHRLEMMHRVSAGRLSVSLSMTNDSAEPMPLSIGFHPYFTLPGNPNRNAWSMRCAGCTRLLLSDRRIPTGKTEASDPQTEIHLGPEFELDDVYTDLQRDPSNCAVFELSNERDRLTVGFGPKFTCGVIYAPKEKNHVCFEPMTAPTDALHLAQDGLYNGMPEIAPGETWTEYFWMEPRVLQ